MTGLFQRRLKTKRGKLQKIGAKDCWEEKNGTKLDPALRTWRQDIISEGTFCARKKGDEKKKNEGEKKKKEEQKQQEQKEQQVSREDAERILEALRNDEKQLQEKLKKKKVKAVKIDIEKDW